ncbi:MAG: heme ABC exporter ATP-binding protein CcmA [Lautropia sp.]|nr:heme ABC exporter ATP-binding protein CcmA [Lautropia sp.]
MSAARGSWLEVRELSLARGPRQLLDRLAFDLVPGDAILLQGPNGSGKSSLLRGLLGLSVATGSIRFDGETFAPASGRLCRHTLYQGHAAGLKGELDALENLGLAAALDGFARQPPGLRAALAATGIDREAGLSARRLSQGQKQRLVLARLALANQHPALTRPLWLLDEPSAALDRAGIAMLDDLLAVHLGRGGAAIIATHLPVLGDAAAVRQPRRIELG